ncbi:hypothetical protein OG239_00385 [Streptomyces sp. NBC_00868]|uniref:hypothetical protein n=1 Tax=unclassified Streptomyces TaxID=2593676 RepID=UPI003248643D|nr:hypothetical protein OG239_00385 [Streptomyces sp. NBC_00868]
MSAAARGTPRREQQTRCGLEGANDVYQLLRVPGEDRDALPHCPDDGLGDFRDGFGAAQGKQCAGDERGGEQGTGEPSQNSYALQCPDPVCPSGPCLPSLPADV